MMKPKYGLMSEEFPPATSDNGTPDKSPELSATEPDADTHKKAWLDKTAFILSLLLITGGILIIILGIVIDSYKTFTFLKGIPDFILATFMIVAGIIGIFAAKRKTKPFIITLMVLTVIIAIISCLMIMHHGIGIHVEKNALSMGSEEVPNYNCTHHYEWKNGVYCFRHRRSNETIAYRIIARDKAIERRWVALHSLLLLLALAAAVISIVASGLTCKATCCAPSPPVKIIYVPVDSSVTLTSVSHKG